MKGIFKDYLFLGLLPTLLLSGNSAEAGKPNILLIVSDDLNTRIGPFMDIDNHTPHLDRLAKEGVRFTRAYSQYPVCGPSRASFMSGLYPETNGILYNIDTPGSYKAENPALADHPSMAGFFRENGYFTARVSKIFHMGVPGGIERGEAGGDEPDSWDYAYNVMGPETLSQGELELLSPKNLHYGSNFARMVIPDELEYTQTDYLAASQAIAILESRAGKIPDRGTNKQRIKADDPFFLAVGFVRPHVPLIAPENCFAHYPEDTITTPDIIIGDNVPDQALQRQNEKIWGMNHKQKIRTISSYYASVRFMDQQVGRLLEALDRLHLRNETIVIFLSDHGYNLGEHDCWSKMSLWEGSVAAPLVISIPGYENNYGTSCETITELIDLYPTLTELCGLADQQPKILQGKSLLGCLTGEQINDPDAMAYTISYQGRAASIRTDRWRYNEWNQDANMESTELYDHMNDPEEHVNIADDPAYAEIARMLKAKLQEIRRSAQAKILTE